MEHPLKTAADAAIGAGALASPIWLSGLESATHGFLFYGGAVLLGLRIASAARDFWRRR